MSDEQVKKPEEEKKEEIEATPITEEDDLPPPSLEPEEVHISEPTIEPVVHTETVSAEKIVEPEEPIEPVVEPEPEPEDEKPIEEEPVVDEPVEDPEPVKEEPKPVPVVVPIKKKAVKKTAKKAVKNKGVKKVAKKHAPKRNHKKKKKGMSPWLIIVLILIGIGIIWGITSLTGKDSGDTTVVVQNENNFFQTIINIFSSDKKDSTQNVAAIVNGEPITEADLEVEYGRVPEQFRQFITKESLLDQMINERLLLQEAAKQGISVSDVEIEALIDDQLTQTGMSREEFELRLAEQNFTYDEIKDYYGRQLAISNLLNATLDSEVTDEDVLAYYNENQALFSSQEQVRARHILVQFGNQTENETLDVMKAIEDQLSEDFSNFCDLVAEFSEDPGSLATCGEYTFPKGQMVPEFEEIAFNQDVNEYGVVKTTFGYHLVQTLEKLPESTSSFEEVEDTIRSQLLTTIQQTAMEDYMEGIREAATIELMYGEEAMVDTTETQLETTTTTLSPTEATGCYSDYGLTADSVIFFHTEDCPHCQRMVPRVQDLESQGFAFHWVEATNSEQMALIDECYSDVIGTGVPEFICAGSSEVKIGETSLSSLKNFAEDCQKEA